MMRPFGWLRQRTAGCSSAVITRRVSSSRGIRWPAVDAGLDPVELRQRIVGEVEPAVGQDVALDAAQDAERLQRLVGGGDLLALAADVVAGEAAGGADRRRVVADREVLVAAVTGRAAHRLDAEAAVAPGRVRVQVAADVGLLQERRGRAGEGRLAQLRREPRQAELARTPRALTRRRGSGPSAATYAAEPVARSSAVPNASGGAATSSIGTPSIVSPRAESITATIWGSAAKRSSSEPSSTHTTASCSHESRQRRVSPAGSPPSASAIAPTSARAWPSSNPRGGAGSRASASTIRASNFGPTPGTDCSRPASTAARNSAGVCTSERPRELQRPLRGQPEGAAQADEPGHELPLQLAQLRDLPGRRPARRAAPRSRARSRAACGPASSARAPPPARAPSAPSPPRGGTRAAGTGWPRRGRAARRTRRAGRRSRRSPRRKP